MSKCKLQFSADYCLFVLFIIMVLEVLFVIEFKVVWWYFCDIQLQNYGDVNFVPFIWNILNFKYCLFSSSANDVSEDGVAGLATDDQEVEFPIVALERLDEMIS